MSSIWYLTGSDSDLSGGVHFNKTLVDTSSTTNIQLTLTGTNEELSHGFTNANYPDNDLWDSGAITVSLGISAVARDTVVHMSISRISSTGTVLETTQDSGSQTITATGTHTFNIPSMTWTAGNKSDRLRLNFYTAGTHSKQDSGITISSVEISTPIVISPFNDPVITTETATGVSFSSATLNGSFVLNDANPSDIYFQYRKVGDATWLETAKTSYSTDGSVGVLVESLDMSTQYEYRLVADYNNGTYFYGTTLNFTTNATPLVVTTESATNVGYHESTLNGSFQLNGLSSTSAYFQYRVQGQSTWIETSAVAYSVDSSHSESLSGLDSNTSYEYRLVALHDGVPVYGDTLTFNTTTYTYTLTIVIDGMGTTSPVAGNHSYAEDTSVEITATPDTDYIFSKFTIGTTDYTENPLTVTMTGDITVTAYFIYSPDVWEIERKIDEGTWQYLDEVDIATKTYDDTNLVTGTHYYRVRSRVAGVYGVYTEADAGVYYEQTGVQGSSESIVNIDTESSYTLVIYDSAEGSSESIVNLVAEAQNAIKKAGNSESTINIVIETDYTLRKSGNSESIVSINVETDYTAIEQGTASGASETTVLVSEETEWTRKARSPPSESVVSIDTEGDGRVIGDIPLSGLVLHLDATAIIGLSDNDPVSTWSDESGNNNTATQATSANQPTYHATAINNKPALYFDGNTDYLSIPDSPELRLENQSHFIVFTAESSGNEILTLINKQGANAHQDRNYWLSVNNDIFIDPGAFWFRVGDSASQELNSGTINVVDGAKSFIGSVIFENGGTSYMHVDRTQVASATITHVPSTPASPVGIGIQLDGGVPMSTRSHQGYIAEIITYNRALTTTERQQVEDYLYQKWQVSPTSGNSESIINVDTESSYSTIEYASGSSESNIIVDTESSYILKEYIDGSSETTVRIYTESDYIIKEFINGSSETVINIDTESSYSLKEFLSGSSESNVVIDTESNYSLKEYASGSSETTVSVNVESDYSTIEYVFDSSETVVNIDTESNYSLKEYASGSSESNVVIDTESSYSTKEYASGSSEAIINVSIETEYLFVKSGNSFSNNIVDTESSYLFNKYNGSESLLNIDVLSDYIILRNNYSEALVEILPYSEIIFRDFVNGSSEARLIIDPELSYLSHKSGSSESDNTISIQTDFVFNKSQGSEVYLITSSESNYTFNKYGNSEVGLDISSESKYIINKSGYSETGLSVDIDSDLKVEKSSQSESNVLVEVETYIGFIKTGSSESIVKTSVDSELTINKLNESEANITVGIETQNLYNKFGEEYSLVYTDTESEYVKYLKGESYSNVILDLESNLLFNKLGDSETLLTIGTETTYQAVEYVDGSGFKTSIVKIDTEGNFATVKRGSSTSGVNIKAEIDGLKISDGSNTALNTIDTESEAFINSYGGNTVSVYIKAEGQGQALEYDSISGSSYSDLIVSLESEHKSYKVGNSDSGIVTGIETVVASHKYDGSFSIVNTYIETDKYIRKMDYSEADIEIGVELNSTSSKFGESESFIDVSVDSEITLYKSGESETSIDVDVESQTQKIEFGESQGFSMAKISVDTEEEYMLFKYGDSYSQNIVSIDTEFNLNKLGYSDTGNLISTLSSLNVSKYDSNYAELVVGLESSYSVHKSGESEASINVDAEGSGYGVQQEDSAGASMTRVNVIVDSDYTQRKYGASESRISAYGESNVQSYKYSNSESKVDIDLTSSYNIFKYYSSTSSVIVVPEGHGESYFYDFFSGSSETGILINISNFESIKGAFGNSNSIIEIDSYGDNFIARYGSSESDIDVEMLSSPSTTRSGFNSTSIEIKTFGYGFLVESVSRPSIVLKGRIDYKYKLNGNIIKINNLEGHIDYTHRLNGEIIKINRLDGNVKYKIRLKGVL